MNKMNLGDHYAQGSLKSLFAKQASVNHLYLFIKMDYAKVKPLFFTKKFSLVYEYSACLYTSDGKLVWQSSNTLVGMEYMLESAEIEWNRGGLPFLEKFKMKFDEKNNAAITPILKNESDWESYEHILKKTVKVALFYIMDEIDSLEDI